MKFEGSKRTKFDSKSRIAVPAAYRGQLDPKYGGGLVVSRGYEGCLVLYPPRVWDSRQEKVEARIGDDFEDPEVRMFQRVEAANTESITMDSQGRILIPELLRHKAGLTQDVLVLGLGDRMEVWDPGRYLKYEEGGELGSYEELAARLLSKRAREAAAAAQAAPCTDGEEA